MRHSLYMILWLLAAFAPGVAPGQVPPVESDPLAQNAALLYWRAFALMPELDEQQGKAVVEANSTLAPLDDRLARIVRSSSALRELHYGARYARCVWGLPLEDGMETLLPHLAKARSLARLGLLRAQWYFQQGKPVQGVDDLLAVLTLGRHAASDAIIVGLLVGHSIESQAISVAAGYINKLPAAELKRLAQGLEHLPPLPSMNTIMAGERQLFYEPAVAMLSQPGGREKFLKLAADWTDEPAKRAVEKLSAHELREAMASLRPIFEKIAELIVQPPASATAAQEKLLRESHLSEPAQHLARLLLVSVGPLRYSEQEQQVRLAMLKAAIAVLQEGEGALSKEAYQDPLGGALGYEKTPTGFRLRSKALDRSGKPVTLEIGRRG